LDDGHLYTALLLWVLYNVGLVIRNRKSSDGSQSFGNKPSDDS
jgi:hypothetical protein